MITTIQQIQNLTEEQLFHAIPNIPRKKVSDLMFTDFLPDGRSYNGVYFFFSNYEIVYIGSASSRTFLDRIASHFDTRPDAFMASLIKPYLKLRGLEVTRENMEFAAVAIREFELACLEIEHSQIKSMETRLIKQFTPKYNSIRGRKKKTPVLEAY